MKLAMITSSVRRVIASGVMMHILGRNRTTTGR
jgi:glycerol dehydrogenase-like iron-containing ADH family enzyme